MTRTRKSLLFFLLLIIVYLGLHFIFHSVAIVEPIIIAHRGGSGLAPENTLLALEQSVRLGVVAELDLQRSADGVLVVIHDASLDRTTNGTGKVSDLSWEEIRNANVTSPFLSSSDALNIPTLAEVLRLAKEKGLKLILELKHPQLYSGIEQDVYKAILDHQLEKQVTVISFDQQSLQRLHLLAPELPLGTLSLYPKFGTTLPIVSVFWPSVLLDPTLVYRAHHKNQQLWVWTVNNRLVMKILLWLGVDGLITDRPDIALGINK